MFGEKLKKLRKENNVKQEDLGKYLNVTGTSISNWENGVSEPSFEILKKIAEYFNSSVDYLLDINQEDENKIKKLESALKEAGINDLDKALKILDVLKEDSDE